MKIKKSEISDVPAGWLMAIEPFKLFKMYICWWLRLSHGIVDALFYILSQCIAPITHKKLQNAQLQESLVEKI